MADRKPPKYDHLLPNRWVPGQSGNPGGRPRRRRLDRLLRELMAEEAEPGKSVGRVFLERVLMHAARDGNATLIREIFDRHDGKVPEPGKSSEPDATIRVVYEDDPAPEAPPDAGGGD